MGKLCCSLDVVFANSQQLPPCIDLTWKDHLLEQDKQKESLRDWTVAVAGVRNKAVGSEFEITFTHRSLTAEKKHVRASRAAYWELGLAVMALTRRVRAQGSPQQLGELLIDKVDRWNFRVKDTARAANLWGTTVETIVWRGVQGTSYSGTCSKSLPAIQAYAIEEKSFPLAAKHMTRDTIKVDGSLEALSQLFSKGNPHFQRSCQALHDTSAFRGTATASEVAKEVNREMANSIEWHAVLLETLQSLAGEGGVLEKFVEKRMMEEYVAWRALKELSDSEDNQDEKWNDFSEKEPLCKSSVEARDVSKSKALENKCQGTWDRYSDWCQISNDCLRLAAEVRQLHWAVTQQSVVTHWLELKEDIKGDVESGNSWLRKMLGVRNVQVMKPMSATHIERFRKSQWRAQPLKREMETFRTHERGLAKQEEDVWKHLKAIYRNIERLGHRVTVGAA
ncbi:hypothetical protein CPLU01_14461 [Colletotrichum plurivorum]|uniref:Uncharacterized protein n=1 Tax=Colletotrichum plurivorum TaxID=2175906 RepID=A0A8H6JKA6_9PEZI|nr:hypothetical protein CPLU01_14461 [Colletotrichum plurivorum]